MIVKCTDKYVNKQLEVLTWSFVFTGLGEVMGKFIVFAEGEDSYEVDRVYELEIKNENEFQDQSTL